MQNNNNDHPNNAGGPGGEHQPEFDSDNLGNQAPKEPRHEPVFSGFEEEDSYEEPDRDTDYASRYQEESLEDEEFDESSQDEDDFTPQTQIAWEDPEPDDNWEEPEPESEQTSVHYVLTPEEADEDEQEEWDDEERYLEEDAENFQKWPLGLIVVAVVALLLLTAGGYGVIQQRSAAQEEIRQLQATLATAANPAEVIASRDAMREARKRNTELLATVDGLTLENSRLTDTVAGLEAQLEAQQTALDKQAAAPRLAAPKPTAPQPVAAPVKATPEPATPETAAPVAAGGGAWFVNFSSYDQRTTAESWATKLKPGVGKVVVSTGNKEGATVYRVRVIGLTSRESAEKISRQLESEYSLPKLWVGHN
ncbi:MAG: hypothetical protein DRR04_07230 [Gammaproteobacteria bacterium]|nr:MAG: hypothetical protein DRR04_07230 [Gammaproteobacteria bacterium]